MTTVRTHDDMIKLTSNFGKYIVEGDTIVINDIHYTVEIKIYNVNENNWILVVK